jgi:hypothetical protein
MDLHEAGKSVKKVKVYQDGKNKCRVEEEMAASNEKTTVTTRAIKIQAMRNQEKPRRDEKKHGTRGEELLAGETVSVTIGERQQTGCCGGTRRVWETSKFSAPEVCAGPLNSARFGSHRHRRPAWRWSLRPATRVPMPVRVPESTCPVQMMEPQIGR